MSTYHPTIRRSGSGYRLRAREVRAEVALPSAGQSTDVTQECVFLVIGATRKNPWPMEERQNLRPAHGGHHRENDRAHPFCTAHPGYSSSISAGAAIPSRNLRHLYLHAFSGHRPPPQSPSWHAPHAEQMGCFPADQCHSSLFACGAPVQYRSPSTLLPGISLPGQRAASCQASSAE